VLFDSCESVVGYGDGQARRVRGPSYQPTAMPPFIDPNASVPPPVAAVNETSRKKSKGSEGSDFSKTNVQEENVDEPDIVKTDGKTIFAVGGNSLHALNPLTPQPQVLNSLRLTGFGHELLLVGDRVLVISQTRDIPESIEPPPPPGGPGEDPEPAHPLDRTVTLLSEIDVSNPAAMRLVSTEEVDGRYVSARLIGDQARIVISTPPAATIAPASALRSQLAGWVPFSEFKDVGTGDTTTEPVIDDCGEVGRPLKFSGLDMLSVLTVDMAAGLPVVDAEGVMTDAEIVYASDSSMYVATERWQGDRLPSDPSRAATAIHKFDISQDRTTTYLTSGFVRGRLLNQFSMDEYKGELRVASTAAPVGAADEGGDESFVSVLKPDRHKLRLIGRVGDLGRGERIYAVRFMDEDAYVVTFRQVDPLYTLDLSAPGNPRVRGELKILGYSAYLHPIGDDRLLGVGAAATKEGRRLGAQVSLFDVGNLDKPKLLASQAILGTRTNIEDTHHAFLYWEPTRRAVIPVRGNWVRRGSKVRRRFTGAIGFTIGKGKIRRAGRIAHTSASFEDPIERSLVVGGRIFTLSCTGVEVAGMGGMREQGWAPFPDPDVCRPEPINFD
jgi:hypothetical protein